MRPDWISYVLPFYALLSSLWRNCVLLFKQSSFASDARPVDGVSHSCPASWTRPSALTVHLGTAVRGSPSPTLRRRPQRQNAFIAPFNTYMGTFIFLVGGGTSLHFLKLSWRKRFTRKKKNHVLAINLKLQLAAGWPILTCTLANKWKQLAWLRPATVKCTWQRLKRAQRLLSRLLSC